MIQESNININSANIKQWMIYLEEAKDLNAFVKENFGTTRWCYMDFFLDENGKNYFVEQIETDKDIQSDWDDDDIIEHICESFSSNMGTYELQQAMLSPEFSKYNARV